MTAEKTNRAVFFDRDGTLNVEVHFLHRAEDFRWEQGAIEAIDYAHALGYMVIVVTNQSGVARGFFPEADVLALHDFISQDLAKRDSYIDAFYYCPHHPEGKIAAYRKVCNCRKPATGMIDAACERFSIDARKSYLVGDKESDMTCAKNAGLTGIRYLGGNLYELLKANLAKENTL